MHDVRSGVRSPLVPRQEEGWPPEAKLDFGVVHISSAGGARRCRQVYLGQGRRRGLSGAGRLGPQVLRVAVGS